MMRECKKCLLYASAEKDILDDILIRIEKMPLKEKCSEKIYNERLDLCKKCDYLVSGTCLKCGCYVEFRAAFKKQKCPDAADRKW